MTAKPGGPCGLPLWASSAMSGAPSPVKSATRALLTFVLPKKSVVGDERGMRVTVPVVVPIVPASPSPTSAKPGPTSPAVTPKIAVSPELGPPGIVVAATGSGFPSDTPVTLVWKPGIGSATVTTDGHGAFKRFILVFERDRLGDRLLQARGFTATTTFLVVPAPVAPPGGHDVQLLFRH